MGTIDHTCFKKELSNEREFICGFGAAFINICLTFPLNKIMFRQMVHGVNTSGAVDQLRKEGLKNLYRGLLPPLMSKTVSVSIMFGSYSWYRSVIEVLTKTNCSDNSLSGANLSGANSSSLNISGANISNSNSWNPCQSSHQMSSESPVDGHRPSGESSSFLTLSTAAFFAGSTEALLCPFERTQMLLQSRDLSHSYNNTIKSMVKMSKFGPKEFYRGMSAVLLRNGPSNIIFFSSREYLASKNHFLKSKNWWINLVNDFITGAVLGALISTLFYPINVVRTKMQTVQPGSAFISIPKAASLVYHERGRSLTKIYYGVSVNCTRALISWGIINASYEVLKKLLYPKTPSLQTPNDQTLTNQTPNNQTLTNQTLMNQTPKSGILSSSPSDSTKS